MNNAGGVVDAQLRHLLDVVERNREVRCKALLDEARAQAQQLVKHAHRDARARLRDKAMAAREQARRKLAAAEARRQTRLRLLRHRADQTLLSRAWQPLRERILQRWREAASRRLWVDCLVEQASAMLVDRHWHIEHPGDWPAGERAELEARLGRALGCAPTFAAGPGIEAGLRIIAGAARVDATLEGLLRARTRLEALMLATLNECRRRLADEAQSGNES